MVTHPFDAGWFHSCFVVGDEVEAHIRIRAAPRTWFPLVYMFNEILCDSSGQKALLIVRFYFKLAVEVLNKFQSLQFVAHPNVQQLLASIWYEGLPGFRRRNMLFQVLFNNGCSKVQTKLQKVSTNSGWEFKLRFLLMQALEVIRIGLLFPFFSLCYIIAPKSSWGQTMRKPFIKFICHSASYFTFLCKSSTFLPCILSLHAMHSLCGMELYCPSSE